MALGSIGIAAAREELKNESEKYLQEQEEINNI